MIPFEPVFNRVLLKRPVDKETKGGVIIPEHLTKLRAEKEGVVVAVGNTVEDFIKDLIGNKVLFAKFAGDWIKVGDEEFYICQEEDILGVVNNG